MRRIERIDVLAVPAVQDIAKNRQEKHTIAVYS
jgi:hypothetical protein